MDYNLRTENRYTLHPQNKKRCSKCLLVYDGIRENFDIHRRLKSGEIQYSWMCKACSVEKRRVKKIAICKDINLYAKKLLAGVRCRAKELGVPFDLDKEYLVSIWNNQNGKCYYTGQPMNLQAANPGKKKSPHVDFPSLDRKTPNLGYVKENVVWTLYGINRMKSDFSEEQFIEFCKIVTERFNE